MSLRQPIEQFIRENALFMPGQTLVLGVSGGPDSLCLLDLLTELSTVWRWNLHVAHVNHGLRPEAAEEAERVRAEAEARGWPFHLHTVDTRGHAAHHKQSLEEAARNLRYQFLAETAHHVKAHSLVVAHTQNDQAETVLMHFLRGSGLSGLKGMMPKTENWRIGELPNSPILSLARPLLSTSRAEVEAYCAERGQKPLLDSSNSDTTFFRNRLRHELLPVLEKYNPNIYSVLSRTATVLTGEQALAQEYVEQQWRTYAQATSENVQFELIRWRAFSLPVQRALLRRAVQHLRPSLRDIDFTPLDAAVRWSRAANTGGQCDVADGLCLYINYNAVMVREWETAWPASAAGPQLAADGTLVAGWEFRAAPLPNWNLAELANNTLAWRTFVDADKLIEPLTLRTRREGDRIQPLGQSGHSKLSDLFINRKIEANLRAHWPLVMSGAAIVWVPGLHLAEPFKVTEQTKNVIQLEFIENLKREV
jgi:tRNA(Ile)-lysidine synthase